MVSLKGIYFIISLFLGSFLGSIFMLAPFLPLMLVMPSWYRWINNRLVATWLTLPVALLETIFRVKVIITGDAFVPGERSVIIMNHRTRMDWMFLWNCLMRYSYLRLEKICLKSSLKSVPGFGWAMQAAAYIFIHRKWKDDKSHFENMLNYFCDIQEPLQLLIFPEGTDLTENSKAKSNEFAEKNGLEKYEYVLHPRTTGFTFVVECLREEESSRREGRYGDETTGEEESGMHAKEEVSTFLDLNQEKPASATLRLCFPHERATCIHIWSQSGIHIHKTQQTPHGQPMSALLASNPSLLPSSSLAPHPCLCK
ncbi:lysocardiolipin acyltransferase 1 isoform X2 [Monodelphis domestica]|uniref:lysocardiolipin acyltransferase 1 isoform X2 n=1 Tax=Monodelphis domestica TaxID=13616 RepID=UPI0024E21827|nr:lysocardiolipin acyltransferase 1 isoform X2 [Monodelphis domestica]